MASRPVLAARGGAEYARHLKRQAQAHVEDLRLDTERRLISKGSALVRFELLKWNEYLKRNPTKETPDPKHVEYIKRIFQKEGCRPLQVRHHIPAIVDQRAIDIALEDAQRKDRWNKNSLPSNYATIDARDGYPELDFPGGIECLRGRHRIEAGKEYLDPTEKWWIVDLYLSGISYELKTLLIEDYANEAKPSDGEIYRKILEYRSLRGSIDSRVSPTTCVSLEMRWWALFHKSREKKLRGLFRNSMLAARFDALAKISGLFDDGMMVTTLHEVLATKFYEQIQCYLEFTWKTWNGFMIGVERGLQRVDKVTVREVELKAPGVSTLDAQSLRSQVLGGVIFSGFSIQERTTIWENILTFKGIIPSLSKFFKDIRFLQACADSMKWLITVPPDKTVFTALGDGYKSQGESQLIQTTENTFQSVTASPTLRKRLGFLVLIAFAMRYHQNLPKAPVKENLKTIPRVNADREVLQRFAALAKQQGFNSPEIEMLKGDLAPLPAVDTQLYIPLLVTTGPGETKKQRCGFPHANSFEEDRKYLFLHNLCDERIETGEGITSFFVLKSWFALFFDPPQWKGQVLGTLNPTSTVVYQQRLNGEDLAMRDARPGTPKQREQEQQPTVQVQGLQDVDMDEHTQDTTELERQRISEPVIEGNGMFEGQEALFVPKEPTTQSRVIEAKTTVIRFVERVGNESDMLNPLQDYTGEVLELRVDHGDPVSLVEQQVKEFLRVGKRTCDRYKRNIPAEDCYSVATREENKNTLFLTPDIGLQEEVEEQGYVAPEEGDQGVELLGDYKIPQEIIQRQKIEQIQDCNAIEGEYQVTSSENYGAPQQESLEEDDNDLLDQEKENLDNARILDSDTIIIYLKKRVTDRHDNSKPAKDWEWTELMPVEVPIGDPTGIVERRLRMLFEEMQLEPHTSYLRKLQFEDCYNAAMADGDRTIYLIKQLWVPRNFASANIFPPTKVSQKPFARAQEGTGLEHTKFSFAQTNIFKPTLLLPSEQELVESKAVAHRDKIVRGPDQPGKNDIGQNRVTVSFMDSNEVKGRKVPGGGRLIDGAPHRYGTKSPTQFRPIKPMKPMKHTG